MTVDSVTSTPTATTDPSAPPVPKAGWKTSEAWLSFAAMVLGAFMASGLFPSDSTAMRVAGMAATVLAAFGYSISRGMVKSAWHGATTFLLIGFVATQMSGCACQSAADKNTAVCAVQANVVDCTVDSVTSTVSQFLPLALELVSQLTGGGGTLDWSALEKAFVSLGIRDGGCLLAAVQEALSAAGTKAEATRLSTQQATSYVEGFMAYRQKRWPGVRFHLPSGKVL